MNQGARSNNGRRDENHADRPYTVQVHVSAIVYERYRGLVGRDSVTQTSSRLLEEAIKEFLNAQSD